ncbi:MAG: hypothetical protein COW00_20060 [Bdellovibrio sp. CG12_big_fil_rev_8_21_14_0_65_39_13]|nr:MAG: hypothetical protein COW78_02805 [Bdellovibrio sp. CG22_combo_CG10-13_8_21_14_all_39_27]PIQ57524.1 MAG: hypothetical protein COW00_20060 [Bdellovibrio sp. CG12_big_fil_rev_8_21_14_0_65_39_13]
MKIFLVMTLFFLSSCSSKNWKEASRESIGIAPKASELTEEIVQIYYARAFSWRGIFGIHPWIAWKEKSDDQYTVAQVTAWNVRQQGTAVRVEKDLPDRRWYDSPPKMLYEARGEKAHKIIIQLKNLIKTYPFKDRYTVWPGPNSNTFVAYMIRNIDELDIELPASAIGKDYLGATSFLSNTASNTGFTLSAFGLLGFTLGAVEGVEVNLFGLHFGVDFWTPALKLPLIGRLGFSDKSL